MATSWILAHWLDLLQSIGIISGFVFTAHSIRREAAARKIGNLIAIAARHHEIWKQLHERRDLSRILDRNAALDVQAVTLDEERFVTSVVIHLDSVHRAMMAKLVVRLEGVRRDIKEFFSLPIPNAVWQKLKHLYEADFIEFVESSLR